MIFHLKNHLSIYADFALFSVRFESLTRLHFITTFSKSTSHFLSVRCMKLIRSALHRATPERLSCLSYEGGFSLIQMQESHGGSTFCAVASLKLMGQLERFFEVNIDSKNNLVQWCLSRQIEGIQGRTNKLEDTCYSFWIGATLNILDDAHKLLDKRALDDFVVDCQTSLGGFSKLRGGGNSYPDLLHSFYSLCWLSISSSSNSEEKSEYSFKLKALNAPLGLPDSQSLKSYLGTRYN